jgi:V8-like Glu-specific endopeptidase
VPTASTPATERDRYATVGPLFPSGSSASAAHFCTASVIASPTGDTVITAAHCLAGTGAGMRFVPGYHLGRAPYGSWQVTGAYVPAAWQREQAPTADYAILTVAPERIAGREVEIADVTGSEQLGHAPEPGMVITAVAYNHGVKDDPVTCDARVVEHDGFPTFDCHGFRAGSSGSPWLTWDPGAASWIVRGVIGGLHQGGCFEFRSHTSAFTSDVDALLDRASSHAPPDSVTPGGDDGC